LSLKEKIEVDLRNALPGWEAQKSLSPVRAAAQYIELPKVYKKAAVMLLLYTEGDKDKVILIKRAIHPNDKHSGQISLPGGQLEAGEDYEQAAFREVEEEIGIARSKIQLLGKLTPLYVYVSNFYVQPFVGWVDYPFEIKLDPSEVDRLICPSIAAFTDANLLKSTEIRIRNSVMKDVPYYDVLGEELWGATAMMMGEFGEILKRI